MSDEQFDLSTILAPESDYISEQPTEVQDVISDFQAGLQEASESVSTTLQDAPQTDEAPLEYSKFEEEIGGPEALKALAELVSNKDAKLTDILPSDAVENLIWDALDQPAVQQTLLADPDVRAAISREILNGHSIEDVQAFLSEYEAGNGVNPETYAAETQASEERVQAFQHALFVEPVDGILQDMGIDPSNIEEISDQLMLAQGKFLQANNREYLQVQSLHERGLVSQARIAEARLSNKWQATLIKQLEKIKGVPALKSDTQPKVENKSYDITSNDWLSSFVNDFKAERVKRGL